MLSFRILSCSKDGKYEFVNAWPLAFVWCLMSCPKETFIKVWCLNMKLHNNVMIHQVHYTWQSASQGRVIQSYKHTLTQYAIHKWNQTALRTSSTQGVIRGLNFLQLALWFQAKPWSCNHEHMTLWAFFTRSLITPKLTTANVKGFKRITHLYRSGLVCLKWKMLHFSKPRDGLV